MFQSEEDLAESTCPVCKKAARAKGKQSEIRLNVVPCKSAVNKGKENKKLLEHLMSHIDDVIDLTKQYKLEGILTASMDKFLRTCNQVKERIEDYANAPPLCDVCKKFVEASGSRITLANSRPGPKSVTEPCFKPSSKADNTCADSTYNLTPEDEEKLGYFEKKFKEIVKVTRLQNDDGSISEEKQVITIRTERRNPRKTAFDNRNSKHLGPGNYYGDGDDDSGNGPNNHNIGRRETKSEHSCRSHQMGEPVLRSCMSSIHQKTKNTTGNFDASCGISKVSLPPESTDKKPCSPLPNMTKSSSVDSQICCPRKTASVCGSELDSGLPSEANLAPIKPVLKSNSAQTCCKEIPVRKPTEDRGTCCLPVCGGDKACPDNKDSKTNTISTDAVWRDAWTSTTDLNAQPSQNASKKTVHIKDSICNNDSEEEIRKPSCCTIKIIAKPKVCCFKDEPKLKMEEEEEVVLKGSMFETIKNIFLPPTKSTESCKSSNLQDNLDIKSICKTCLSKLSSSVSKRSSKSAKSGVSNTSSCKTCQANIEQEREVEISSCLSCPSLNKSLSSLSCKSTGVGSDEIHTCKPKPSIHSQKHTCCLSKDSDDEDTDTCCAMAQTKSSKSICCSKKKSSTVCCPAKAESKSSAKSSCSSKDVSTCTKRSARFDVRPLKRRQPSLKLRMQCTCKSDSHINRRKAQNRPFKQCKSFYEDDYYFRW